LGRMCTSMPKSLNSHSCEGTLQLLTQTDAHCVDSMNRQRSAWTDCGSITVSGRRVNTLRSAAGTFTSTSSVPCVVAPSIPHKAGRSELVLRWVYRCVFRAFIGCSSASPWDQGAKVPELRPERG
jgi:hypothetical protein